VTSPADIGFLAAAGVVGGAVGTAGGITSLISYPALLWAGLAPAPANIANIVGLMTYLPGSALASRPELKAKGGRLLRWSALTAAGGAGGAALLLATPSHLFARVVPFLIALASLSLIVQPRLSNWRDKRRGRRRGAGIPAALATVSVYSGYFGAGSGVMTLAILLFGAERHMARANAMKNVLVGVSNVAAAAVLVCFASVDWAAVAPLAIGAFVGSTIGPQVARKVPASLLRWAVALVGLGLAVKLWISPM